MAKAKKTNKKAAKVVKTHKKAAKSSVMHQTVDNKLSIFVLVAAILVFVLAALSMSR